MKTKKKIPDRSRSVLGGFTVVSSYRLQHTNVGRLFLSISVFHRAFFNSIIDKTPTHALFIQYYISLAQRFSNCGPRTKSGPRVCPCGPFRLNISPKKTKNKINVNCVSHTIVENLKQSLEITYNKRL